MDNSNSILNPYDYAGDLHNQGLDFIGKSFLSINGFPSDSSILANLSADFFSRTSTFGNVSYANLKTASIYALNYTALDMFPKGFSEEQILFVRELESIIDKYESPFCSLPFFRTPLNSIKYLN